MQLYNKIKSVFKKSKAIVPPFRPKLKSIHRISKLSKGKLYEFLIVKFYNRADLYVTHRTIEESYEFIKSAFNLDYSIHLQKIEKSRKTTDILNQIKSENLEDTQIVEVLESGDIHV